MYVSSKLHGKKSGKGQENITIHHMRNSSQTGAEPRVVRRVFDRAE